MTRKSLGWFMGIVAIGVVATQASDAAALWAVVPASQCVHSDFTGGKVAFLGPWMGVDNTGSSSFEEVFCPFVDSSSMQDTDVTGATLDIVNLGTTAIPAGQLNAAACVFTNWQGACGKTLPSPSVPAGGHAGLSLDVSALRSDVGHGFAMVAFFANANTSTVVAGVRYF